MESTSEGGSKLAAALAKVQGELTSIPQTKIANAGTYSYKYADLADVARAVYPITSKHGLSYIAKPTVNEAGQFVLAYALMHEAGEREDGEYPLPASGTAQQLGSAITYARRYTFCAVVGVVSEEDTDGRDGVAQTTARPKRQQRRAADEQAPAAGQAPDRREELRGRMGWLISQIGLASEDALRVVSDHAGRQIKNSRELTLEELTKINTALERLMADQEIGPDGHPPGEVAGVDAVTGEVEMITQKTQRRQRAQRRELGVEGDDGGPHDQEFWGWLSGWFDREFTSSKEQSEEEALEACRRMQIMVDAVREQEEGGQ